MLCTVDDPGQAIAELKRVLKPDGQLLFIEHVLANSERLARWQDRLQRPWKGFARGCRCNQPTLELLDAGGIRVTELERASTEKSPPLVRPLAFGRSVI